MSWYSPRTWDEIAVSIAAGWSFNARRHRVSGTPIYVLTSVRGALYGHLDDFAHEVIASCDRVNAAYMAAGRDQAYGPDDYVYVVARDGNAIAGITYSGRIRVNPAAAIGARRYTDAIARIRPALRRIARRRYQLFSDGVQL